MTQKSLVAVRMSHNEHPEFVFLLPWAIKPEKDNDAGYIFELTPVEHVCHVLRGNELIRMECHLSKAFERDGAWCTFTYDFGKDMRRFDLPSGCLDLREEKAILISVKWSRNIAVTGDFIDYSPLVMANAN